MAEFSFEAPLWLWRGGTWCFVTLPFEVSDDIEDAAGVRGGFGSVRVEVTVGKTVWRTSLFPSKELEAFILPFKRAVRVAEGLEIGDTASITVRLLS